MARLADEQKQTVRLAARFLAVFQRLLELTQEETPSEVVAQLSVNQLRTLHLIYREPGISQKALAERLDVTPASISIWISRMLDAQLVERFHHETDARVMCLYLGPVGRELVHQVEKNQIDAIAELLDGLLLEEQQLVVEALERALVIRRGRLQTSLVEQA